MDALHFLLLGCVIGVVIVLALRSTPPTVVVPLPPPDLGERGGCAPLLGLLVLVGAIILFVVVQGQ